MRNVLITGGTRGIGRATAERFLQSGDRVAIFYAARHDLAERMQQLWGSDRLCCCQVDVADADSVKAAIHRLCGQWQREIDALINNAGISQQALFTDLTAQQWRRMFAVHVDGAFFCTQAVLPGMIRRRQGSIVNVSSMWGQVGASCEVSYSAAKAALIGMTRALAKEVGLSGVRVNCVSPGVIDTEMNGNLSDEDRQALEQETPLHCLGTPKQVADAIYFLCSEQAQFITGQVLGVNGGFVI